MYSFLSRLLVVRCYDVPLVSPPVPIVIRTCLLGKSEQTLAFPDMFFRLGVTHGFWFDFSCLLLVDMAAVAA